MASKAELARQVAELDTQVARLTALQAENDRLTRVTHNALRVIYSSGAALNTLFKSLVQLGPTDDHQGVKLANDQVIVILYPFDEKLLIIAPEGINVPNLEIKAENFVLNETQQVAILGTVERIRLAIDEGHDTIKAELSLTGVVTS